MNVLLTGGNGFVGLNIVESLTAAGHRVTAIVRPTSNTQYLDGFSAKILKGKLSDKLFLRKAMEGQHAVIHTAGVTSSDKNDLAMLRQVNVECTRNICSAAYSSGVKRLVYTSTSSTIGANNSAKCFANEDTPLKGFRAKNPYGISKLEAEAVIADFVQRGLPCVILNPTEVIGPYDYNFQWGRIVLAAVYNTLPFMPPGGGSFCYSRDVGRAHVNALTMGKVGERYLLSGPSVSFEEYIKCIIKILNTQVDIPNENYWMLYLKALMHEMLPKLYKIKPAVEAYRMRVFAGHYYFSSEKAKHELNYTESSLQDMVNACIAWYRNTGIIPSAAEMEKSKREAMRINKVEQSASLRVPA